MPFSPFTRLLGLAIVLAYAAALLWPVESAAFWGWPMMIILPTVIGLFSWSAVRDAPPFDDHAFHRTLPPGDGFAFRRLLRVHGMILAGIALLVVVYCQMYNFGWPAVWYGIAILTVPMWTLMAASGVANSLATFRRNGTIWPYLAIFVVPVLSAMFVCWLLRRLNPPGLGNEIGFYYPFIGLPMIAILGAVIYPVIWWLVSVRKLWGLGLGLGLATGIVIPWMHGSGEWIIPQKNRSFQKSHVTVSRKPIVPDEGKWLRIDQMLAINGLREGEFINLSELAVGSYGFSVYEVPENPAQQETGLYRTQIVVGRFGGAEISWSEKTAWNYLRTQIPTHETFAFWNKYQNVPTHTSILKYGESATHRPSVVDATHKPYTERQRLTETDFVSGTWRMWSRGVCVFAKAGEVDAETGGSIKMPTGGMIRVEPLKQDGKRFSITFRRYIESPWQSQGLEWFGFHDSDDSDVERPWVIAVDQSGKHALALSPRPYENMSRDIMLGRVSDMVFDAGEAETPDDLARMEMLRHSHLYVFWPRIVGPVAERIPLGR